jgi:hypothetical protein
VWVALAVVTLVLSVNVSYAHYQQAAEAQQMEFSLAEGGSEQVYLNNAAWTKDDDGNYCLTFNVTNGVSSEEYSRDTQEIYVRVFATVQDTAATDEEGEELAESKLTLTVDGCELTGVPTDVTEGSEFYNKYGAGRVYSFCTESGEEVSRTLYGGELSSIAMVLTVENGTPGAVYTVLTTAVGY